MIDLDFGIGPGVAPGGEERDKAEHEHETDPHAQ